MSFQTITAQRNRIIQSCDRGFERLLDRAARSRPQWLTSGRFMLVVLGLLCLSMYYDLGSGDIKDWDEGLYAWRAKVVYFMGGATWLDQAAYSYPGRHPWAYPGTDRIIPNPEFYSGSFPPLMVWLMALAFHIFGATTWAARFFPVLLGIGTVWAAYEAGRRLGRNRWAGFWSAFCLVTVMYFLEHARKAQFDGPMVFFIALTVALYVIWQDERKIGWLIACGLSLGLGLMTKIVLPYFAAIYIGIVALYHVYAQTSEFWRRGFVAGLLVSIVCLCWSNAPIALFLVAALAVSFFINRKAALAYTCEQLIINGTAFLLAAPWHLFMTLKHGRVFWDWYLGYHVIMRSSNVLDGHWGNWWYYMNSLWMNVPAPHVALLLSGIIFGIYTLFLRQTPAGQPAVNSAGPSWLGRPIRWDETGYRYLLLLIWILIPFLIITAAPTRRQTYSLQLYPAYAMMTGVFLMQLWHSRKQRYVLIVLFLMLFLTILSRSPSTESEFYKRVFIKAYQLSLLEEIRRSLIILFPILAGAGGFCLALWALLNGSRAARRVSLFVISVAIFVFGLRNYRDIYDGAGKHNFGWAQVEPYLSNYESYDVLVFIGDWEQPSVTYYLGGLRGLYNPLNIYGIEQYVEINVHTKDPIGIMQSLPKDKRISVIADYGYFNNNFDAGTRAAMMDTFTIQNASNEEMLDGRLSNMEAWLRSPSL